VTKLHIVFSKEPKHI